MTAAPRVIGSAARLIPVLQRVVPLAAGLVRRVRRLAVAAAVGAGVIWLVLLDHVWRPTLGETLLLAVVLAILLVPPLIVFTGYLALRAVLALPDRLRAIPEIARGHAGDLAGLVDQARDAHQLGALRLGVATAGLARSILSSREMLAVYAPVIRVVSPPFILASLIAAALSLLEITVALVLVLWVALR
jgi:hypothetical protein